MSQRASWDEAWKRYAARVFHNWSKDARGLKVRSPKEGQAHRHKEAACILGVGIVRGVSPLPHSRVFGKGKQGRGLEPRHFEKVDTCMGKGVG